MVVEVVLKRVLNLILQQRLTEETRQTRRAADLREKDLGGQEAI